MRISYVFVSMAALLVAQTESSPIQVSTNTLDQLPHTLHGAPVVGRLTKSLFGRSTSLDTSNVLHNNLLGSDLVENLMNGRLPDTDQLANILEKREDNSHAFQARRLDNRAGLPFGDSIPSLDSISGLTSGLTSGTNPQSGLSGLTGFLGKRDGALPFFGNGMGLGHLPTAPTGGSMPGLGSISSLTSGLSSGTNPQSQTSSGRPGIFGKREQTSAFSSLGNLDQNLPGMTSLTGNPLIGAFPSFSELPLFNSLPGFTNIASMSPDASEPSEDVSSAESS